MAKQPLIAKGKVKLKDYSPDFTDGMEREEAEAKLAGLQKRLAELQEIQYAQGQTATLMVIQAMDAAGKDSLVKKVFDACNPHGVIIHGFKAPTEQELAHDFLWRIHARTPARGYVGVFVRSHYEDVLIARVNKLVPKQVWKARYDHINAFEKLLHDSGTRIMKFYLHVSKDEQKKQLQERLDDPTKHWKFSIADLAVRERWDDYMKAFEDVFNECSTDYAPWHIVPGNYRWYRNYVVTKAMVDMLESLDLKFPPAEEGLDKVVIPD
jgi:PPK2 family polyphosphate:nucleotide phosphotransferase